jgi:hypothetical protein
VAGPFYSLDFERSTLFKLYFRVQDFDFFFVVLFFAEAFLTALAAGASVCFLAAFFAVPFLSAFPDPSDSVPVVADLFFFSVPEKIRSQLNENFFVEPV